MCWRRQADDLREFSRLLQLNAAKFRLPALPGAWPEWMTAKKRREMADNFEQYAAEVDAMLSVGTLDIPAHGQ